MTYTLDDFAIRDLTGRENERRISFEFHANYAKPYKDMSRFLGMGWREKYKELTVVAPNRLDEVEKDFLIIVNETFRCREVPGSKLTKYFDHTVSLNLEISQGRYNVIVSNEQKNTVAYLFHFLLDYEYHIKFKNHVNLDDELLNEGNSKTSTFGFDNIFDGIVSRLEKLAITVESINSDNVSFLEKAERLSKGTDKCQK